MDRLFYTQLITSFLAGGVFVALLSFIAEKVKSRTAGIVLAFPSTATLSYFFLGWSLSATSVSSIIPATFIPLGISVLFSAIYSYSAQFIERFTKNKSVQIALSFLISTFFWILFNLLFSLLKINQLLIGLFGYLLLTGFTYYIMHRKHYQKAPALAYSLSQTIGRAIFAGLVVALVVFLGKTLSPFWGGTFAMFPAAMSSSLMIFHWYYESETLFAAVQRFSLGSLSIVAYSLTVLLVFPKIGFIAGTFVAFCVSLGISYLLSLIKMNRINS